MDKLAISIYQKVRRERPHLPLNQAWREAQEAAALVNGVARPFRLELERRREAERVRRALIRRGLAQKKARRDASRARYIESQY